jgi:tetratricopeptide (TPR) repeat protein
MERPKYKLIFILLLLGLTLSGHGVFAKKSPMDNAAFQLQSSTENSRSHFRQLIYKAYISGKMEGWKTAIDNMEKQKKNEPEYLLDLINYQYGYVAWCLGNDKNNEAKHYLSLLDKNLEKLKSLSGESAEYHSYTAAAYGFKIGLSTWRAPFFGPKSMNHAELALEKNPRSFQANMEMGNIWNHMPAVFGGSDEKALKYYYKALEIIEKEPAGNQQNNWMYLNLLTLVGQMHQDMKNQEQAKKYFEQALQIEPGFIWVKEELLPSLKTN